MDNFERKYNNAKDYIIDEIIGLAEFINFKRAHNVCRFPEAHTFDYLCRTYINAFGESFSIRFDSNDFIEKIIMDEEYMIRKFDKGGDPNVSF